MTVYELPLSPAPQTLSAVLPNGNTYRFRFIYQFNDDDCWLMDIGDQSGNTLVAGIPLVTGADLLAQYAYLGLGVKMWVTTDANIAVPPRWWNLGVTGGGHVWIEG